MKIRAKVILSFVIIFLTGSFFVFFVARHMIENVVKELIGNYNVLLSDLSGQSIEQTIYSRIERWDSYFKGNSELPVLLVSSNAQFDQMSNRDEFIAEEDGYWKNSGSQETTDFIELILKNSFSSELEDRIEFYAKEYGYDIFPEIFITNKYGVVVAASNKTSDYNQADEEWWQKAKSDRIYVGDIIHDESSGFDSLEICIRIDDDENNFLGVGKIIYNIQDVFRIVDEISDTSAAEIQNKHSSFTRNTVNAFLLDKDGGLIYSTKNGSKESIDGNNLIEKLKNQGDHLAFFYGADKDEIDKLFSHSHLKGYKYFNGLNWILVISKETNEVLQPLSVIIRTLAIISAVSFFLVIIIALAFSIFLIGPIRKLIIGTEMVEAGNLNHRVGTNSKDEIGQLSRSFDKMVDSIKKSRAEVDRKVAEQTEDIKKKAEELENQQSAILNILEDVDEEKNRTQQERDKIDAILHSIGDGVFVVDSQLRIIMVNHVTEEISGFSSEELIGQKYDDVLKFVYEADEKKVNDKFVKEAIATGEIKEMSNHTLLIRKDGKKIPVADSAAPLNNKEGNVIGCVVVFRDVTKEREIDKAKTEFVSLASHQLRTPLSTINWYAEMLLAEDAGELNKEQKSYLDEIYKGNQRMVDLVNSLLNVSRLELGTFSVEPEPTDLSALADNSIKELEPQVKAKEINFKANFEKDLPKINVDQKLAFMIFQNLLSNAVKYTPEKGNVSLEIKKQGEDVLITVADSGYGIPKEQQGRIFTKMFRADNIREKDSEGTGLGLYILKSIMEQTGGRIWFESEENKGTKFFVSIPLSGMEKKEGTKKLS